MREYIIENKKNITIILGFLVFLFILSIVVKLLGNNHQVFIQSYVSKLTKEDVSLKETSCDLDTVLKYNNIPYFNLNNEVFDSLNEEILSNFLLRACYQDGLVDYEASLNKNILSVALSISYETTDDLAYLEYKTYTIDTDKNTRVGNADLLQRYHLTLQEVSNKVTGKLMEYYEYEKKKKYLENQTFNDYLNILEYQPITLNNMNLYVDSKNDLYLFKDYTLSEGMSIDEEFPNLTIKFKLT